MRTFEEIIGAAELIMAAIDADCRRFYRNCFPGFEEITDENEEDFARKLVRCYGEGTRHDLFALVAFYSKQFVEKKRGKGNYTSVFWFLADKGGPHDSVDSTLNPEVWKYATRFSPDEISMLIDWVELVYASENGRGWGGEEDDARDRAEAIAHLTKISVYGRA